MIVLWTLLPEDLGIRSVSMVSALELPLFGILVLFLLYKVGSVLLIYSAEDEENSR